MYDLAENAKHSWKISDIELPAKLSGLGCYHPMIGFGQILFLFHWSDSHKGRIIYCFDLLNGKKWTQSKYYFVEGPWIASDKTILKDGDDNVHFISNPNEQYRYEISYHFVASLYDLLPTEILDNNEERNSMIVIGFVRKCQIVYQCLSLPMEINHLIAQFYSIFCGQ